MLRSMTGFGTADGDVGGRKLFLDIKSVNHRYFNFFAKVPTDLIPVETEIQRLVKAHLSRGQVSVFAAWDRRNGGPPPVVINREAAREAAAALESLRAELGLGGQVELAHLINFPAVFAPAAPAADPEALWAVVKEIVEKALASLDAFRLREGEDLKKEIASRLEAFAELVDQIETRRPDIVAAEKARLEKKLSEILEAAVNDPAVADRAATELAIYADRSDITEELVRLRSHIDKFREMLAEGGALGRKLDFLLQEMNREVNTIGSKTPDAEAARVVVEMKAELEKVREQVQNVE